MLFTKKSTTSPNLQEQIDTLLTEMKSYDGNSSQYDQLLTNLERLYKLQEPEKGKPVSKDALLATAGNLAGILLILNFERVGVVTSKALSFVLKSKL